ncbi:SDR family NAD(P)-dependent oxidoreductase [Nocardia sp. CA-107356]|uniref:SDR family NAD(P)-dependent oxidoreductase n=1 Tax=Nocardia sp. CA-107356 TaxID=3239972 RepID=UPI003D90FCC7
MQIDVRGKVALVTGSSAGIGVGCAHALSAAGARVIVTGRRGDQLEQVAASVAELGYETPSVVVSDVSSADGISRLLDSISELGERVDILVNNAGGSRPTPLDAGDEFWDEALGLNFTAARRLTGALLPAMRNAGWGRVINISGSMEPRSLNAASAAKAALHIWSKGLSCDAASAGITVNCIAPGRITSEQTMNRLHPDPAARDEFIRRNIPAGRFGEPSEIGNAVAFLASPLADYITGAVLPVDGGMHYFAH